MLSPRRAIKRLLAKRGSCYLNSFISYRVLQNTLVDHTSPLFYHLRVYITFTMSSIAGSRSSTPSVTPSRAWDVSLLRFKEIIDQILSTDSTTGCLCIATTSDGVPCQNRIGLERSCQTRTNAVNLLSGNIDNFSMDDVAQIVKVLCCSQQHRYFKVSSKQFHSFEAEWNIQTPEEQSNLVAKFRRVILGRPLDPSTPTRMRSFAQSEETCQSLSDEGLHSTPSERVLILVSW